MAKMNFTNSNVAAIFERDNCTFEAFTDLMTDVASGKKVYNKEGAEVSTEDANKKIREMMFEVLGVDENSSKKEIRQAIRRHKVDVFEIIENTIENMIETGWGENPFFNEFVEVKSGNAGDANEFYAEDNVILTVSELAGNHHNLFRQRLGEGQTFPVKTSWYGIKIYAEYERFMSGNVDWAQFIQKIYEAFDKKVNAMVFASLDAAGSSLPAGGQWVKTGPLSDATKDTFIELIEDVQTANGTDVVIMGTRAALSKLTKLENVNWISDEMKVQRNTLGRVGYFEGVRLVELSQVFADNDTTTKLISNNKLMIMPVADNKFIKVYNEGDAQVKEISDGNTNVDKTIEYEYQMKMGVATVIGRLFGIWNITSTSGV